MKKLLNIFALAIILLQFIPAVPAKAKGSNLVTDSSLVAVYCLDKDATYGDPQLYAACEDLDDSDQTIEIFGDYSGQEDEIVNYTNIWPLTFKIVCTPSGTCEDDHPIYYKYEANVAVHGLHYQGHSNDIGIVPLMIYDNPTPNNNNSNVESLIYMCSDPVQDGDASCEAAFESIVPTWDISGFSQTDTWHMRVNLRGQNIDISCEACGDKIWWTYHLIVSLNPIEDDCLDNYIALSDGSDYTINANSSTGVNVAIDPTKTYLIYIHGGPWLDGGTGVDRYDAMYHYNGTSWVPIAQLQTGCSSRSEQEGGGTSYSFLIPQDIDITEFYIRVNDTGGTFTGNTGSLTMTITEVIAVDNCAAQYSYNPGGTPVKSGTISPTSIGTLAATLTPNSYYVIETTGGYWRDGSDPTNLFALAVRGSNGSYGLLGSYEYSNCQAASGSYVSVYFQASEASLYLRVNDTGGNFSDNSGPGINYSIYESSFTRYPYTCESMFQIGDLIESRSVAANAANGIHINSKGLYKTIATPAGVGDPSATRWYVLDVTGGPWTNGATGNPSYTAQLGEGDTGATADWYPLPLFPTGSCVVPYDGLGHYRIYWPGDPDVSYWFRANGSTFSSNTGTIGYNLYSTTSVEYDNSQPPATDTCDATFSYDTQIYTSTIYATSATGVVFTGYTAGEMTAIVTSGGPWNDGSMDGYGVQISDDNGQTWISLAYYDGIACAQSADGDHLTVFMYPQSGKAYRFRVYDSTGTFFNNTGTITVTAYEAAHTITPWTSCEDYYNLYLMSPTGAGNVLIPDSYLQPDAQYQWDIDVHLENGQQIGFGSFRVGDSFALATTGGPWWDDGHLADYYSADISSDNGATWDPITVGYGDCSSVYPGGNYYLIIFTIGSGENYRIRVHDTDGDLLDFNSNGGTLGYFLYATKDKSLPKNGDMLDPGKFTAGCSINCQRPDDVLNIAAWLEYFRCQFSYYIAWCPEHTAALGYIKNIFTEREPFGTINDTLSLVSYTRDEVASYDWSVDSIPDLNSMLAEGGQSGMQSPLNIINNGISSESPWAGGEIKFEQPAVGGSGDLAVCADTLLALIGGGSEGLAQGYCFVMNMFEFTSVFTTFFVISIIGAALFLWEYFQFRWLHKLGF